MFGAGGGTSSYREVEETDIVLLWGSNAREAHPIYFHHVLKGVRNGARLVVVDPRRTVSAQWADTWLGLDVGSDIALANAMAREILHAGLENRAFIEKATTGFDAYRECVEKYTLEYAERETGVPASAIRDVAHAYAKAGKAQLCWTLGITEHHNAVDNVFALINLVAADGPRRALGLGRRARCAARTTCRAAATWARCRTSCPAARTSRTRNRARSSSAPGAPRSRRQKGMHLSQMFEAMEHGTFKALFVLGENPVQSEADQTRAIQLLESLEHVVVQDMFLTKTAEIAARGAAGRRLVVRGRRHGDLERAARAARAQGARPARAGARGPRDPGGPRAQPRRPTGDIRRPKTSGTSCARSRPGTAA